MVISSGETGTKGRPAADWRAGLLPFRFSTDTGSVCLDAWTLQSLSDVDLATYAPKRFVRISVGNFPIRNPGRNVQLFALDPGTGGPKPGDPGTAMPQPSAGGGLNHRTRWDLDLSSLFGGPGRQKVRVEILLSAGLKLYPGFEVTAKTRDAARRLVNLELGEASPTQPWARFWVLSENGAGQVTEYGFNIGLVALDTVVTSGLSLPVIVDPSVRARG
jgi:hypothetical protein